MVLLEVLLDVGVDAGRHQEVPHSLLIDFGPTRNMIAPFSALRQNVTWYDILAGPLLRDWQVLAAGLIFWFAVQYGSYYAMMRCSGPFRRLPEKERWAWSHRAVAVANGLVCSPSAYLWWFAADTLGDDLYKMYEPYRIPHALIVSYFFWDCLVCFAGGWSWLFKCHAICSFTGTYMLAFPCSHRYVPYFTGCFELSNAFIHVAEMIDAVGGPQTVSAVSKAIFAVLFFLIRVLGGTVIVIAWTNAMVSAMYHRTAHSDICGAIMIIEVWLVMGLQYAWFGEVLRGVKEALGISSPKPIHEKRSQ